MKKYIVRDSKREKAIDNNSIKDIGKKDKSIRCHTSVICSMLLATALVISRFRILIPVAGIPIIKIGLSSPIYKFIAIMFGPFYGGLIPALGDIINAATIANYMWMLTVTEFLKGFMVGALWQLTEKTKINNKVLKFIIAIAPPGILFCLVNTFVMQKYFSVPNKIIGTVILVRIAVELGMIVYNIATLMFIIPIYDKFIKRR
jgi:hypothetical protein